MADNTLLTVNQKLEHIAKNVIERNLDVKKDEQVIIRTYPHTLDVADQLYLAGRRRGTEPFINLIPEDAFFQALTELDEKSLKVKNKIARGLAKVEDVEIFLAGPKDPMQFQRVSYSKINAAGDDTLNRDISHIQKVRKVRSAFLNIGQATPERAKAYGIEYEPWRDAMLDALMVDPDELALNAKSLLIALKKGKEGLLRSRDGGILKFKLAGRAPILDDGILRPADLSHGDCFVHLPAGVVFTAPLECSAEGRIAYDIPQPSRGKYINGVWVNIMKGVLSESGAAENEDELDQLLSVNGPPEKRKLELGYCTIGVNPAAKPFFIDHQMAIGVIGFHFGNNDNFGGTIKNRQYHFGGFSQHATLEIDGKIIIDKGKIVKNRYQQEE